MIMKVLRGFIAAVCFVLLSVVRVDACTGGGEERLTFEGFKRVTHLSTSGMNLWVEVTNRSCWRMVVVEAEVDIYVEDAKRLTLSLRDRVEVPRKATTEVLIPIRITSHSMFSIVGIIGRIATGRREDITINYRLRAGTPLFKRTFAEEGVPVEVLLDELDMPESEIGILERLLD